LNALALGVSGAELFASWPPVKGASAEELLESSLSSMLTVAPRSCMKLFSPPRLESLSSVEAALGAGVGASSAASAEGSAPLFFSAGGSSLDGSAPPFASARESELLLPWYRASRLAPVLFEAPALLTKFSTAQLDLEYCPVLPSLSHLNAKAKGFPSGSKI